MGQYDSNMVVAGNVTKMHEAPSAARQVFPIEEKRAGQQGLPR